MVQDLIRRSLVGASLALLACSQTACTATADDDEPVTDSDDIVGGAISRPNAWPGAVALYKGSSPSCGGTLVADRWVVTAGHCISRTALTTTGGFTKVVIGRTDLQASGGETRTVDRVYRHPGYTSRPDNDIALVHLSAPSSAAKAKIVSAAQVASIVSGAPVTAVGWGRVSERTFGGSPVLREVTIPIVDTQSCAADYPGRISANMLCAGLPQGGKDACQGDSGGPLFMKIGVDTVQVGIVSWGRGCARPNAPGVYTRLSNYLQWLDTTSGGEIATGTVTQTTDADE